MNFKHVILFVVCLCLLEEISAEKKRRLVKRLKKQQPLEGAANDETIVDNSRSDLSEVDGDDYVASSNLDRPRDARFILHSVFGSTTITPPPVYSSYQYAPYKQELWGVESSQQQVPQVQTVPQYNYALANSDPNLYAQPGFPYEYEGPENAYYRAYPTPAGFDDNNVLQDKTFDSIQQVVTNAFNGPNGQNELDDNAKLARAVLPATVAAFLALTVSSVFLNLKSVNATSKEEVPLLWKLPIDFQRPNHNQQRQRRHVEDNFILEDDNEDFPLSNTLPDYGQRLKDAIVMLAMIETHPDCMTKIACIFGRETKRSDQRTLITDIVTKLMPKRLDGFTQEFIRASRNDNRSCESYNCSTCFSV